MISPYLGLLREGNVIDVNARNGTMRVGLVLAESTTHSRIEFEVPIPGSWTGPNGEFTGGCPLVGSRVWCAQAQGNRWVPLVFSQSENVPGDKTTSTSTSVFQNPMAALRSGRWLTQVNNSIRIFADPIIGIQAGNPRQYIHLDPNQELFSNVFENQLSFSNASRRIDGVVKRDLVVNSNRNSSSLESHFYNPALTTICLDPKTSTGGAIHRNPPFAEVREIVYEFSNEFGFTNDEREIDIYDNEDEIPELITTGFNRRTSRADTLSLSQIYPNHLIESIKGTVVDIYGNIVDLNRWPLPSGKVSALSFKRTEGDKSQTFKKLREQARKSLAYHIEINTRNSEIQGFSDLKTSLDNPVNFARNRSHFFFDVDKEGQFKWNVPASSEVGNVPLLVRYENYTTLKAAEEESDPNKFRRNNTRQDVFLESFGIGAVTLKRGESDIDGVNAVVDRRDEVGELKLGTAYHNIQNTLELHNRSEADPVFFHPENSLNQLPLLGDIVNPEIIVSGPNANAGGRSGTISLDGFLNLNIGANTSDRQSLWLDCAGGIVANIGRDLNNRSYQGRFDGDIFIQVGGTTVTGDVRFEDEENPSNAVVDLRVVNNGMMTIMRIDEQGVRVATPGGLDIVSRGKMRFTSSSNDIVFNAKGIYFYGDDAGRGRWVQRKPGQTI
ncbi:MAG TPA: hypothetical protein VKN14_14365 [Flavobacteriaceae bacterium]|nr:hypothetical protein [Flavobacteriaceae bacterium]